MVTSSTTRVVLAEPFELTRRGIHEILSTEAKVEIVADLGDVRNAAPQFELLHPDVVLIGMASKDELAERLAALTAVADIVAADEWAAVGVITDVSSIDDVIEPIRAGAKGVLDRRTPSAVLVEGIHALAQGQCFVGPKHARVLFDYLSGRTKATIDPDRTVEKPLNPSLTQRENQVLAELIHGYRTVEIAEHLGMSQATVKTHVRQICRKMNVRGRTAAILKYLNAQAALASGVALPLVACLYYW